MTLGASPLQQKSFHWWEMNLVSRLPHLIMYLFLYIIPAGGDGHDDSRQSVGLIQ